MMSAHWQDFRMISLEYLSESSHLGSALIGILKKTTRIPMTLTSVAHSPETAAFHIRPSCKSKILHTATSTDMTSCKAKPMPEIPRGGR